MGETAAWVLIVLYWAPCRLSVALFLLHCLRAHAHYWWTHKCATQYTTHSQSPTHHSNVVALWFSRLFSEISMRLFHYGHCLFFPLKYLIVDLVLNWSFLSRKAIKKIYVYTHRLKGSSVSIPVLGFRRTTVSAYCRLTEIKFSHLQKKKSNMFIRVSCSIHAK